MRRPRMVGDFTCQLESTSNLINTEDGRPSANSGTTSLAATTMQTGSPASRLLLLKARTKGSTLLSMSSLLPDRTEATEATEAKAIIIKETMDIRMTVNKEVMEARIATGETIMVAKTAGQRGDTTTSSMMIQSTWCSALMMTITQKRPKQTPKKMKKSSRELTSSRVAFRLLRKERGSSCLHRRNASEGHFQPLY